MSSASVGWKPKPGGRDRALRGSIIRAAKGIRNPRRLIRRRGKKKELKGKASQSQASTQSEGKEGQGRLAQSCKY
jgi:hypothetical protein